MIHTYHHIYIYIADRSSICSAISNAFLLAIDGAATAAATVAVTLAGAAVRGETLGGANEPLLVTGAFLFAHNSRPNYATLGMAPVRAPVPGSVASADHRAEPGYVEPTSGAEEPAHPSAVILRSWFAGLSLSFGFGSGREGADEQDG